MLLRALCTNVQMPKATRARRMKRTMMMMAMTSFFLTIVNGREGGGHARCMWNVGFWIRQREVYETGGLCVLCEECGRGRWSFYICFSWYRRGATVATSNRELNRKWGEGLCSRIGMNVKVEFNAESLDVLLESRASKRPKSC